MAQGRYPWLANVGLTGRMIILDYFPKGDTLGLQISALRASYGLTILRSYDLMFFLQTQKGFFTSYISL